MQGLMRRVQKHLFYCTVLTMFFLGSLGAIFQDDASAKVIAGVCASALFVMAMLLYWREHPRLS
ncbi:hypothetical protein D3Y57_18740 [Sphingomonas paeninsulae]|uniref:Uncharacterized protein n=1 Tax=Sphingomonas paeninsulae TaxID=2319844 RepID=A0A494TJN2_SPHPE|nr:hypothetical protein D3Y57_18740 [Sphingomonas paeninsulae]